MFRMECDSDWDYDLFLTDSDSDEDVFVYDSTERPNFSDTKVIELINHQIESKSSHKSTTDTAKFFNGGAKVLLPDSKYKIKKRIDELRKKSGLEYIILSKCDNCDEIVKKGDDCCQFRKSAKKTRKTNDFLIYLPLGKQLKKVLNDNFNEIICFLNREKNDDISDTDDGFLFKKIQESNPLSHVLSLTLNTDGGNIYKSSKNSLWPVQLYMNFLPPNLRFRPENILVVTLYFGENKPDVHSLLYPLAKEIDALQKNKITVHSSCGNEFYEFFPSITMASCDLPAKQMLLNIIALSGRESCSFCHDTGESVPNAKGKTNIRYTFKENFIERTHSETIQHAISVKPKGNPVKGIKGRSVMELFGDFDLINSFTIDYMHNLSGIVKHIVEIWIGKKTIVTPPYKNFKIQTAEKRKMLNQRLLKLKPYSAITRKPRSLIDLSLFKASELLMCLWFYLPLTINGILDKKVIDNFTKISVASYTLCKKKNKFK